MSMLKFTSLVLFALPLLVPESARAADFLTPAQTVDRLVEGRVWSALTNDGKRARLTFNPDGTGTFEGPITLPTTWEISGAHICVHLSVAGTKCLRFRAVAGGLEGWRDGSVDLVLSR